MVEGTPWVAGIVRTRRQMCESLASNSESLVASQRGKRELKERGLRGFYRHPKTWRRGQGFSRIGVSEGSG
jgi:hypothetical protein